MRRHRNRLVPWAVFSCGVVWGLGTLAQFGPAGPKVDYDAVIETDAAYPGSTLRAVVTFHLSEGWHVNSNKPLDDFSIATVLIFDEIPGVTVAGIVYPKHKVQTFAFSPDPIAVYGEIFRIGVALKLAANLEPQTYTLTGRLRYQACNDRVCAPPVDKPVEIALKVVAMSQGLEPQRQRLFEGLAWPEAAAQQQVGGMPAGAEPPAADAAPGGVEEIQVSTGLFADWRDLADEFSVAGRASGYMNVDDFLAFIESAQSGEGAADANRLAGMRWWLVLLVVLGGGLALNLTPCVLPLIPINIAIIGAGARAGSRTRGFALGTVYGGGIAFVYGLLGLVVVLGVSSAFGAINATPWFNGAIAVLFVVLALAMFEVINIDFSKYQAKVGVRKTEGGSFVLAFVMGSIAALLAGACVAPVVIYTIVYAQDQYSKGVVIALALPFLLGVGMALPWPFAGAGLSFLPKPGAWMTRVKQAFGVFILLFALYYAHLAYSLFSDQYLVDAAAVEESTVALDEAGWLHSLDEGLAQAKAENKPVLLDFWATWCKSCMSMNKSVLKAPETTRRLEEFVKIKYNATDRSDPGVVAVSEYYDVLGLPTYLVLLPKGG